MLVLSTNVNDKNFAPWEITSNTIKKGVISLAHKGLSLSVGDVSPTDLDEGLGLTPISKEKIFLSYDNKNLTPNLEKSNSDLSYIIVLVSQKLEAGSKVIFVRSTGAYLIEYKYNVISEQFDAIVAFRSSSKDADISLYTLDKNNKLSKLVYTRKGDVINQKTVHNIDPKQEGVLIDRPLSILPYRPYQASELIFVHRQAVNEARAKFGESKYKIEVYGSLKELRKKAKQAVTNGYKTATLYYQEAELKDLSEDQKFFSRVLAEYLDFLTLTYKGEKFGRYYFKGKSTLPQRKESANGKRKPASKKQGDKKPYNKNKAPKREDGKKPFKKDGQKKPFIKTGDKKPAYKGSHNNAKPTNTGKNTYKKNNGGK